MNRKAIYWLCNIGGWFLYGFLNALLKVNPGFSWEKAWEWFAIFFFGLFFSHLLRFLIIRFDWLRMNILQLFPRLGTVLVLFSFVQAYITISVQVLLFSMHSSRQIEISQQEYISSILAYLLVFVLWTLIYFAVHYFLNYKKAEIENLKWQASVTEVELNQLKSQLNPHFVFNCMNSIRALVDENPAKAKEAVTQLASILRNTLMMGRSKMVSFGEELRVVKDYLALESIRLEERLHLNIEVGPETNGFEVPPLMLQTLVENGIKHGIATLPAGGRLEIKASVKENKLIITILNSGQYKGNTDSVTGFGIRNTLQRLNLLYNGRASFLIENLNTDTVRTQLLIPKL
jgi:two-component system LytT family sensor kinase